MDSAHGSPNLDLLTPPRFDSISSDFSGSPLMFHFPYQISSTNSTIPKLIDRLVYSLLNFQNDTSEVFALIFESDPDCFAGVLLQTAAQLIESFVHVDIDRLGFASLSLPDFRPRKLPKAPKTVSQDLTTMNADIY